MLPGVDADYYNPKLTPWQVDERDFPSGGTLEQQARFLLRYAILAPSSHNTQPWQFCVEDDSVLVFLDRTRWLRVADTDRRELYTSVGCALENLLIAADHFGLGYEVEHLPSPADPELIARVRWRGERQPARPDRPDLFGAITTRCTNHRMYEERRVSLQDQQRLLTCFDDSEISLYLTGSREVKRKVDALVTSADALQFSDPEFREELGHWVGQGAFGAPWLIAKLSQLAVTYLNLGQQTAKKDSEVLMSSPLFGLLYARSFDRRTQIKVGQACERIYLMATTLGLSLQPVSQIMQVPETRRQLVELLPEAGAVPHQPFRLGYAEPEKEHTPRRRLEEVLVALPVNAGVI